MSTQTRYLTTYELHRLNNACVRLWDWCETFDEPCGVYLVGSAGERSDFRDVDVRVILDDAVFDRVFGSHPRLWELFCYAMSGQLRTDTGLPIDFQVQRMTEAAKYPGGRNPLGTARAFAGRGDATRFDVGMMNE